MLSASSYGHFSSAKECRSQCHIFRFESRLVGNIVRIAIIISARLTIIIIIIIIPGFGKKADPWAYIGHGPNSIMCGMAQNTANPNGGAPLGGGCTSTHCSFQIVRENAF